MIVSRYLAKEILQVLLAVTLVLLVALLSQQLVRYLNFVTTGKIPAAILIQLVSFEIPYLVSLLLPLGLYLGIILSYSRLYVEQELPVLLLSGYSYQRLIKLTLSIAFGVAAIVFMLMVWVNPYVATKRAQLMSSDQAMVHLVQTLMPGRFQVSPDGRNVLYVKQLSRDRTRAENVFFAQETKAKNNTDPSAWVLTLAKQGYQTKSADGSEQYFVVDQGNRYEGVPGQNDYKIIQFQKYTVRTPQNSVRIVRPSDEMLSLSALWQGLDNPNYAAEWQWRLSIALSTILLALLALPLAKIKPRQGRYLALLPAILIYVVYVNLLFISRHWLEQKTIPFYIGMWWVHGLMLIFVSISLLYMLRRRV
jgi:lipopolysaccharide export system permease protein